MRPDEFESFREGFIEDWAIDLAKVENLPLELARAEATRRTDADLTDAVETEGHRLYVITADDDRIGTLWFSFGEKRAFLDDITIDEEHRGQGHGRRALELMERELQGLGVELVQLNVYAHNPGARSLYDRIGYEVTGVKMSKKIGR